MLDERIRQVRRVDREQDGEAGQRHREHPHSHGEGRQQRIVAVAEQQRRRTEPGGGQHLRHHRGGRSLPVAAGDGDAVLHAHQFAEHFGPRNRRDLASPGLAHLVVVGLHRRGIDHHVGAGDVIGMVAEEHPSAERIDPPDRRQHTCEHLIASVRGGDSTEEILGQ